MWLVSADAASPISSARVSSAASREVVGNHLGCRLGLVQWSCMGGSRQARAPRERSSFGHLPAPQMLVALIQAMLLSTLEPNGERTQ